MSLSYHSRNGRSTPWLILLIGITVVLIVIVVLFTLGQGGDTTETEELPINELSAEDAAIDEPQLENEEDAVAEDEPEALPDTEESEPSETDSEELVTFNGSIIAGTSAPLIDFNQEDYEKAIASDKLVVLYFYANWCPICKVEVTTAAYPAFDELTQENVVGFRVNFNDNQTDSNEKDLASEFGVAYQHTKVFVKNGERVLKSPESWTKERYLEEIANFSN